MNADIDRPEVPTYCQKCDKPINPDMVRRDLMGMIVDTRTKPFVAYALVCSDCGTVLGYSMPPTAFNYSMTVNIIDF